MTLIWNLLIGGRMGRYTGSPHTLVLDQRVEVRGFSAGSFAGLSLLQLLWKIPNVVTCGKLGAIACPPQLLITSPATHVLHLFHYEADQLCVCGSLVATNLNSSRSDLRTWIPRALPIVSTLGLLSTTIPIGFRLNSRPVVGTLQDFFSFTQMLQVLPRGMQRPWDYSRGSASDWNQRWRRSLKKQCCISPLLKRWPKLIYLRWGLSKHLCMEAPLGSVVELRDRLIELVSVGNLKHHCSHCFGNSYGGWRCLGYVIFWI